MNKRELEILTVYVFDPKTPAYLDVLAEEEWEALPEDDFGVYEQVMAQVNGLTPAPEPTLWMKIQSWVSR